MKSNSLYVIRLALIIFVLQGLPLQGELVYKTLELDSPDNGKLKIIRGEREGRMVYKLTLIDRNRTGNYNDYLERFYLNGKVVLIFSSLKGKFGIDFKGKTADEIYLYYTENSRKPAELAIEPTSQNVEYYGINKEGFYISFSDEERKAFRARWEKDVTKEAEGVMSRLP